MYKENSFNDNKFLYELTLIEKGQLIKERICLLRVFCKEYFQFKKNEMQIGSEKSCFPLQKW